MGVVLLCVFAQGCTSSCLARAHTHTHSHPTRQFTLYAAVLLLVGLFVAYWAFWGTLLNSLRWRMQVVLSRIAPSSPDATRALAEAANRTFLVVVFFVLSISLNILTLLRQLLNKTVLLRTTQRASIFRLVHVDLKRVEATPGVFRSLFASFLFDLLELWTLSSWILYPIFVAVFWTLESSCVESELALAASSISPLIACMYVARFHLLAVAIGWCGLVTGLSLMYFFRYLDERRKLVAIDSKSRWWHQSPFVLLTVLLFLAGCAAAILSAVMLGKPLLSNQSETTRVTMAVPGVVLMCGSLLLLFHLGRKLVASWRWSKTPHVSFFFERGCALSGNNPDTPLASAETDVDLDEIGTPYMRATNDEILF